MWRIHKAIKLHVHEEEVVYKSKLTNIILSNNLSQSPYSDYQVYQLTYNTIRLYICTDFAVTVKDYRSVQYLYERVDSQSGFLFDAALY